MFCCCCCYCNYTYYFVWPNRKYLQVDNPKSISYVKTEKKTAVPQPVSYLLLYIFAYSNTISKAHKRRMHKRMAAFKLTTYPIVRSICDLELNWIELNNWNRIFTRLFLFFFVMPWTSDTGHFKMFWYRSVDIESSQSSPCQCQDDRREQESSIELASPETRQQHDRHRAEALEQDRKKHNQNTHTWHRRVGKVNSAQATTHHPHIHI